MKPIARARTDADKLPIQPADGSAEVAEYVETTASNRHQSRTTQPALAMHPPRRLLSIPPSSPTPSALSSSRRHMETSGTSRRGGLSIRSQILCGICTILETPSEHAPRLKLPRLQLSSLFVSRETTQTSDEAQTSHDPLRLSACRKQS